MSTDHPIRSCSILVQIFFGDVILGDLMRVDFLFLSIPGTFHAGHGVGLKRVSFFQQLVDALRIRFFDAGQSLQIPR